MFFCVQQFTLKGRPERKQVNEIRKDEKKWKASKFSKEKIPSPSFSIPVWQQTTTLKTCIVSSLFFGLVFVCFSNPTSPPRSFIGLVQCVSPCTLSSLAFKGVARGIDKTMNQT